ncbi:MAG: hypothetical protein ACRDTF_07910 [Pseudonocardiaceae bacterium]
MPMRLATSAPESPACSRSVRSSAATCRDRIEVCGLPGILGASASCASAYYAAPNPTIGVLLAVLATLDGPLMGKPEINRADIERKIMDETVVEKTWQIPAHGGKGPVTITLRMPEVTITDSQGRHIVISPEQADAVSSRIGDIAYWLEDGVKD